MKLFNKSFIIFLLSTLMFGFNSCKKKDNTTPAASTPPPLTSPNPNNYFGVMSSSTANFFQSGSLSAAGGTSSALFSSNALINNGVVFGTSLDPGTVSINGVQLKKSNNSGMIGFNDSTYAYFPTPNNWVVSGANGVPNINYNNVDNTPIYTGYAVLPDTIKLNQNNIISLQGITGADEITVYTSSGFNVSALKYVTGSTTSITLSPSDLSSLSATNVGALSVICSKNSYQLIGGKTYKFQISYQLQKIYIVLQ